MALTAYFDASGHPDDQEFVVVAGFVADAAAWADFDRLWTARLRKDGITCFHATDFAGSYREFKEWRDDEPRRVAFSGDLMDILQANVFRKFGCVILNNTLDDQMSEEVKTENFLNAYSLAGRVCVTYLFKWLKQERWETVPELIFERGDKGQDRLRKGMERDGFPEPIFKPKKDALRKDGVKETGVVPLQAADWLAYESFLAMKKENLDSWARREFESTLGEIGVFTPNGIQEIQKLLAMDKMMRGQFPTTRR
jgi:hypothetical protein